MSEEEDVFEECPNCSATWGCEEFDWQRCGCCGWPNNVDEEDGDLYDDYDQYCEDRNPNDSRNL